VPRPGRAFVRRAAGTNVPLRPTPARRRWLSLRRDVLDPTAECHVIRVLRLLERTEDHIDVRLLMLGVPISEVDGVHLAVVEDEPGDRRLFKWHCGHETDRTVELRAHDGWTGACSREWRCGARSDPRRQVGRRVHWVPLVARRVVGQRVTASVRGRRRAVGQRPRASGRGPVLRLGRAGGCGCVGSRGVFCVCASCRAGSGGWDGLGGCPGAGCP
jgi:hypothetical protein